MNASRVNHSAYLWQPQADEITLTSVPESAGSPFPFGSYWHLQVSPGMAVGLGRRPGSVASDAAAMRKLSAVAAEVAGELERRAEAQKDGSDE